MIVAVAVADGPIVGVAVAVADGQIVGVAVAVADGPIVGVAVIAVGVADGPTVGVAVIAVGVADGPTVGVAFGVADGPTVGVAVLTGSLHGMLWPRIIKVKSVGTSLTPLYDAWKPMLTDSPSATVPFHVSLSTTTCWPVCV